MTPRKTQPSPKGLLPKIKCFLDALGDRYHRALQVIDEALASDNLKDKIWAVDFIFKRLPAASPAEGAPAAKKAKGQRDKSIPLAELQAMSEPELLNQIRNHLKDWEPD